MSEPTTTLTRTKPLSGLSTSTITSTKSLWTVGPTTGTITATITAQPSSSITAVTNGTEEAATASMSSMSTFLSPATSTQDTYPLPTIDIAFNNKLSPSAKAGIGVGVTLGGLIIFSLLAVVFWIGKRTARRESVPVDATDVEVVEVTLAPPSPKQRISELGSENEYKFRAELRGSDVPRSELDARSTEIGEFETVEGPQEMNNV
ncbi:hypothetical protein BJ875DRAFT_31963 [Amylocarpus encephaloides]|uniref:Mid2 domain-containing protein n=1 Tax=Amylocarpus encephaloides TaxID=45428 RepID=A0A9P8C981_9HELO|nr:hypothetical protein BJ875DRAFT_31963 [Amylocarpus encephaloides]